MHRRWRVRHSYPQPVVDLVRLLLPLHAVRKISGLLDIPMSVIYRWRALERANGVSSVLNQADERTISSAVARCHELGFRFTNRPAAANLPLWPSLVPTKPLPEVSTSVCETSGQVSGAAGGVVDDGKELPDATPDVVELRPGTCTTGQCYTFDARKERSARRVRQRLEAARRMIDVEYFLEIDCRVLADAAQMSRHHFIRMFSDLFGSTPHQYLIRTRVEAAKRLLLASREPIEVIATGVGFRSGQSLNRAFKQTEGVSVSKFCSTIGKHEAITQRAAPFRVPGQDLAHTRAGDAMTSVASGASAFSSTC
ncbi:MAG TPA: AraC family transcriptional regulator [Rudaea sp.]|nr:AraC family transcriptional regulator [Rudaea sp.]